MATRGRESALRRYVREKLEAVGCWAIVTTGGGRSGAPDVLACLQPDGRFLALELKKKGGRLSKVQRTNQAMIRRAGGVAEVIRSREELRALLHRLGSSPISQTAVS